MGWPGELTVDTVSIDSKVEDILEVKSTGLRDPSGLVCERKGEVKVTLEVFSLVDSEGSDALNEVRNTGRKRGSAGVGVYVCLGTC